MLSRLILVIALLTGVALFIQSPAHASERHDHYRHDRYEDIRRAPAYHYGQRPAYHDRHYRPAPRYRDDRYRHARRHDHYRRHHHHHRDYYYSDRRW